jgi:transcriptional regulator with XRE-family HTH domain
MIKPQAIKQIENKRFNSKFPTLESLKQTCKSLGITNSVIYKEKYKEYGLPAHPERIYKEWVSYKDFFDIVEFISYAELQKLVIEKNLTTLNQYKKFVKQQNDPSLPLDLEGVYKMNGKIVTNFLVKMNHLSQISSLPNILLGRLK